MLVPYLLCVGLGFVIGLIFIPIGGQKIRESTNRQTAAFGEEYYASLWVQKFERWTQDEYRPHEGLYMPEAKQRAFMRVWNDIQRAARSEVQRPVGVEGVEETWEEWPRLDIAADIDYSEASSDGHVSVCQSGQPLPREIEHG